MNIMQKIVLALEVGIGIVVMFFVFFFGVQFGEPIKQALPSLFEMHKKEAAANDIQMVEPEQQGKSIAEIKEILDNDKKQEKPLVNVQEIDQNKLMEEQRKMEEQKKIHEQNKENVNTKDITNPAVKDEKNNREEDYDFEQFEGQIQNGASQQDNTEEINQIQENDVKVPESAAKEVQIDIGEEPVKIEGIKGIDAEEIEIEDDR
jgi:hypothetical protein